MTGDAQRTTCGQVLAPESLGVTHPVLPCGAKVVLRYGDTQVLTDVIDNALVEPGRQLEVTDELATILGLDRTVELESRFAAESGGSIQPLDPVRGHGSNVNPPTREGSRHRS